MNGPITVAITDFNLAKKIACWGTFGPTGKDTLKYVRLIDCSTEHLLNIMKQTGWSSDYGKIISSILEDRIN